VRRRDAGWYQWALSYRPRLAPLRSEPYRRHGETASAAALAKAGLSALSSPPVCAWQAHTAMLQAWTAGGRSPHSRGEPSRALQAVMGLSGVCVLGCLDAASRVC
jgi:hypothetical protein